MTIQEALDVPGPLVAIWDVAAREDAVLGVFSLADGTPKVIVRERVPKKERVPMTAMFRERGLRIGSSAGSGPFRWISDDKFTVFSNERIEFDATRSMLSVRGRQVEPSRVAHVTTFVDDDARGHRGVRLVLAEDRELVMVAEEDDETAVLDPTYGWDNVLVDALWASMLGRDLAAWLGVAHHDDM